MATFKGVNPLLGPATLDVYRKAGYGVPMGNDAPVAWESLQSGMNSPAGQARAAHPVIWGANGMATPAPDKASLDRAYAAYHQGAGGAGNDVQNDPAATANARATLYDTMFRNSIAQQRQSIDAHLRSAMTDISGRRAAGQQIVSLMPGEINKLYDSANPAIDKSVNAAKTDMAAAGASAPGAAQNAGVDAIKAAIEGERANSLANQPYMNIGNNEMFNRQAGQANAIAQDQQGQLDNQMAQYYGQQATANQSQDNQLAQQEQLALFNANLKSQMAQGEQQQAAQAAQASLPQGTKKWYAMYAQGNPQAASNLQNANIDPKNVQMWKDHPDIWKQSKQLMDPVLVGFLRTNYGLS